MPAERDSHNTFAYPGFPYPNTHPDRLAAMAILHGLSPAPVEHCRVLEIGCNEGANLIPMAYAIPTSEFVGFDLARLRIEQGQERIRALGLRNARIFAGDLLQLGSELGQFDYIVAHGFYAWVPELVRGRMMALCGELLSPDGVAFVSYNAMPGGHLRVMLREMMLYHVQDIEDPRERVTKSLVFLHFLLESRPQGDAFRLLIQQQLELVEKRSPELTFHDWLTDEYHPVLFSDFVDHARMHGMQYLSEAVLPPMHDPWYRSEIRSVIEGARGEDIVKQEQMLDFLRARAFRETLLCRAERVVRRDFPAEHLRRLLLASPAISAPGEAQGSRVFTLPGGARMESNHAGAIALLDELAEKWPSPVSLAELEPRLAAAGFLLDEEGVTLLMRLIVTKFVETHAWKAPVAGSLSEFPRASACSRLEARTRGFATTLLHGTLRLDDPVVVSLLKLLDGTRDRAELFNALKGEFPDMLEEKLEAGIEPSLVHFHRIGLLEA
ncbi:MAG: class I SAM-dependent methyltransferase [Terracidiphilus sp.]|jgi:methyltransferase-like protein